MRHLVYNHLWNGGSPSHHGYHGVQYSNALIWIMWGTIILGNLHIVLGLIWFNDIDVSPFIPPCSPKTGPGNSPKTIPTHIPHLPPHLRKATPEEMPKSGSHVSGFILGDIYILYIYIYTRVNWISWFMMRYTKIATASIGNIIGYDIV